MRQRWALPPRRTAIFTEFDGGGNKTTRQLLFYPKVGSREWGREVSFQMLSALQRAQQDASRAPENLSLPRSGAPNLSGQSHLAALRPEVPTPLGLGLRTPHPARQGAAADCRSLPGTARKAAFRSVQSPRNTAKGRARGGLVPAPSCRAPPPQTPSWLENVAGTPSAQRCWKPRRACARVEGGVSALERA